nr:hemin uptake protein HemP [Jiella mangrovi]
MAKELFGERKELEIHLGTTVYRLRLTKAGKLILTK